MAAPEYKVLQTATKLQNELRFASKGYFKAAVQQLSEGRKRYMMRISKIKYDQL